MIYPAVDLREWTEKHGIVVQDYRCPKCRETFRTTIAVMTRDSAGLVSPEHSCGKGYYGFVMVPWSERAKRYWSDVREYWIGD